MAPSPTGLALLLLSVFCTARLGLGLRLSNESDSTTELVSPVLFTHAERGIPLVSSLQSIFQKKCNNDMSKNLTGTLPGGVQLLLGVMATQKVDPLVLATHRGTWMNRSGICALSYGRSLECTVYVAFVYGDSKAPERVDSPDELFLNGTENMNDGKTFDFFHYAARAFPWTTHIGKMDLDTFPHIDNLLRGLKKHLDKGTDCSAFFGMPVDFKICGRFKWCPPRECGFPLDGNFRHYQARTPNCWSYMQGGLYILSSKLAESASREGGYWSTNKIGHEDLVTGHAVAEYAKETGACVDTWDNASAFDHLPNENFHKYRSGRRFWPGPQPGRIHNKTKKKAKKEAEKHSVSKP